MVPGAVGGGLPADVGCRGPHAEPVVRQSILRVKTKGEGVTILGMQDQRQKHMVRRLLGGCPVQPTRKSVQRVVSVRLGEGCLMHTACELVSAGLGPVGTGQEQLASSDTG